MKRRKPWVAGLLSLLLPGLGHLYAGAPTTAVFFYGLLYVAAIAGAFIAMFSAIPAPFNVVLGFSLPVLAYGFAVVFAVRIAKKRSDSYRLKKYNRWYVYLGIVIIVSLMPIPDLIRLFLVQAFKIPAPSMRPTLKPGDRMLVNKLAYGLKWPADCRASDELLSWTCYSSNTVIEFGKPTFGDVVVFRFPEDEDKLFIKRIAGLPGDSIEIRGKILHVNGEPIDDSVYTIRPDPNVYDGADMPRDNFGPVVVPEDSYFVLGDNRDQSLDSRFWGFIRNDKILGKAATIYWSYDESPRWERIGRAVHHPEM